MGNRAGLQNCTVLILEGNGIVGRSPLGIQLNHIIGHIGRGRNLGAVLVDILGAACRLAAFCIPAIDAAVGTDITPLALGGPVSGPAGEGVAGAGEGVGTQSGGNTVGHHGIRHGTGAAVGIITHDELGSAGGSIHRQLLEGIAVDAGNTVMVGVGVGLAAVGVEIQLAVAGADIAALDLKQRTVVGAGHTEHQSLRRIDRTGSIPQIKDHDHAAVEPIVVTGNGDEQMILIVTEALIDKAGQIQIFTLDVNIGLADGAQLGQLDVGALGAGADRAGVHIHAQLGDEGDHTAGNTLNGQSGGAGRRTVIAQRVACHLGQGVAHTLQTNDGIAALVGGGDENVGIAVDAPNIHIVGMTQVVEIVATGIGVIQLGGGAGIFIGHRDKGLAVTAVDLDGIHHLRAHGQTLHTGAGAIVIDLTGIGVVAIEQIGGLRFHGNIDQSHQKHDQ